MPQLGTDSFISFNPRVSEYVHLRRLLLLLILLLNCCGWGTNLITNIKQRHKVRQTTGDLFSSYFIQEGSLRSTEGEHIVRPHPFGGDR